MTIYLKIDIEAADTIQFDALIKRYLEASQVRM